MKSIRVEYDEKTEKVEIPDGSEEESWVEVCEKFNDDVHRLATVTDQGAYTGLYECFDDDNRKSHYLVEEDSSLYKKRHINMLRNLGLET